MSLILETERLLLRPVQAADISYFHPLLNDFEIARNLATVPHPYTEDDGCAFVVRAAHELLGGRGYTLAILEKESGAFIGMAGIHGAGTWILGYWLARSRWGRGYATEAVARLVAFAFEDMGAEALRAGWFADNPSSGRVLKKLGFEEAEVKDCECLARGTKVPTHWMTLSRGRFLAHRSEDMAQNGIPALLETERLSLRPPKAEDVPALVTLLNDYEVSKNLTRVPYPYGEQDGYAFVALAGQKWALKQDYAFAIVSRAERALLGLCGVHPERGYEFGYWLGQHYWGRGYATEAARSALSFAFGELRADRVTAGWFHDNPASGRVLQKLGFVHDGMDERESLSRRCSVVCNKVVLTREAWAQRMGSP